ncbi:MAG: ABC transporter ATP-binding protein/permease [Bacteroidales bacterium]|jgi:ATP-binding cassette subfamily B protein|nr:ABC transporter ATP-binding protein/permease [Bacteroidales bacterium]
MIGLIFFTVILAPIKSTVSILFTQSIIDAVGEGTSFNEVLMIILYFLSFNSITLIFNQAFDTLYAEKKLVEIRQKINLEIYNKIIVTDYKYFDDPEFYNNYTWAVNEYTSKSNEACTLFNNMCRSVLTLITMLTFIAILGPWLIVISVVQITISTLIEMKKNKINIKKREETIPVDRKISYVHRLLYQREYVADIKSTNIKRYLYDMYNNNGRKKILVIKDYAIKLLSWNYIQNFINIVYDATIFGYISYGIIVSKKIIGVGKFMGLLSANGYLVNALYSLYSFISQSNNLSLYADKIHTFFQTESTIEIENTDKPYLVSDNNPFSVEFQDVSFSYANSNFALNNINIKINPGERVAIVGENGAGKTTLVKLLLRLYDATNGDILYDGNSIKNYNINSLRNHIGVAFQTPNIYAIPMIDNINVYKDTNEMHINDIIKKIGFDGIFVKTGANLSTEITKEFSKDGIILSGGEIQKLGIARIMASGFKLLVLDEPSSALDPIAEHDIMKLIYDSSNTSTSIIIAHHLSTVRDADRIYVMQDGTIIENGTHDELMKLEGMYFKMFTMQSENYIK